MKLLRYTTIVAAAVSVGVVSSHIHADSYEAGVGDEYDGVAAVPSSRFRFLADGSGGDIIIPVPSPITEAPTTTAPPPEPTTVAPTDSPTPTTSAPTTTTAPSTTAPPTPTKTTTSGSGSSAATPTKKTSKPTPTSRKPSTGSNTGSNQSGDTYVQPDAASSSSSSTSASGATDVANASTDNKMSTGVVVGIVAGIVGGVTLLALAAVCMVRKRRDDDDDPLSPFELSMDKGGRSAPAILGSSTAGAYGGGNGYNQSNATANHAAYSNNSSHHAYAAGASSMAAGAAVATRKNDTISSYSSNGSQGGRRRPQPALYDTATSPNSMNARAQPNLYHTKLSSDDSEIDVNTNESSNLWLSAMEPQAVHGNDVEGYAAAAQGTKSMSSRNSYDDVPSYDIDIDQTSVMSGGSDVEKEFPDYADGASSRGSYEL